MKLSRLETLAKEYGCAVEKALPLASCTSFHIGGAAALAITVTLPEALPPLLRCCREESIPWLTLGNGSNLLVSDAGFDGAVLRLAAGEAIRTADGFVCPAGTPLKLLCRAARDAGLRGLEFAYGIPGTVGGALFMNAGAYGGQMADVVSEAVVADESGLHTIAASQMTLAYRHSAFMARRDAVIVSVTVRLTADDPAAIGVRMEELLVRRREKQPLEFPSAGSYFKRPEGQFAGTLIERCGLKGCRVGDAQISEKHAGFLINRGHATCADVLALERRVREQVLAQTGFTLEREVQLVGGTEQ